MALPEISVIIPVHNSRESLPRCLESVLAQDFQGLEVIFVDDGSTDDSLAVAGELARRHDCVTVLSQPNLYAGIARNTGLVRARGKYAAFLDSDDTLAPGALPLMYALAEKNGLDLVKAGFVCEEADTGSEYATPFSLNSTIDRKRLGAVLCFRREPERLLRVADMPWNGLYRRDFLLENGILFNGLRCSNDHSFYIHCLLRAKRIAVTDDIVARYRVHQSGSLIGRKAAHYDCQLENYRIVRGLCAGLEAELSRAVLREELIGVFNWYNVLRPTADEPEALDRQLRDFLLDFDENDVGAAFLRSFAHRGTYFRLRFGTAAPGRGATAPERALRSLRVYGWRYIRLRLRAGRRGRI